MGNRLYLCNCRFGSVRSPFPMYDRPLIVCVPVLAFVPAAFVYVCIQACVSVWLRAGVHACLPACLHRKNAHTRICTVRMRTHVQALRQHARAQRPSPETLHPPHRLCCCCTAAVVVMMVVVVLVSVVTRTNHHRIAQTTSPTSSPATRTPYNQSAAAIRIANLAPYHQSRDLCSSNPNSQP
jgi:hypothetical protein